MKGGFNKIIRNIVAGASDTEFEKVIQYLINFFYRGLLRLPSILILRNLRRNM